ncbi:DUF2190 family protein [Niallia sp. 01092]|uniref:DUF2190 family protein n=1 Tax=unclassified Niallia TaxID=2837522 RepID=UPI003FD060D7
MLNNPQTSYVQRGESIDFINSGSTLIKANDVVPLTTRIGIAGCDIPVGAVGSVNVIGVYDIPAVTTEAFAAGQTVYWKNNALTTDSVDAVNAGWVVEAKASSKAIARVKIG